MEVRQLPLELENMILNYLITALRDDPEDLIAHAAEYFSNLRYLRRPIFHRVPEGSVENIRNILGERALRRHTVRGEIYNPEKDDDIDYMEIVPKTEEEIARIKSKCCDIFMFRNLDELNLKAVIDAMQGKHVEEGEVIIRQGDDGDFFYLIDKGKFTAEIKDEDGNVTLTSTYEDEGYFGELALLYNQPKAATVQAITNGLLWAVTRKTFNKIVVRRAFKRRNFYLELINPIPQLKHLTECEKLQLADALRERKYSQDDIIYNEGDKSNEVYIIIEGKVSVRMKKTIDKGVGHFEILKLEKGEFFGERALMNQPRTSTIIAVEDTTVAFFERETYERLLGPCPSAIKY